MNTPFALSPAPVEGRQISVRVAAEDEIRWFDDRLAVYDQKENTPRCEQTAAAALLARLPALDGKLITADPLHCQRGLARTVVEKGGDYLFQIKSNQPRLLKYAQGLDALKATLFLPAAKAATAACKPGGCTPSPSKR